MEGSIGCDARDQLQSPVAQETSSTETMTIFEHRCLGHLWQQALSQFFEDDQVGSRWKYSHCLIYLEVLTCKMLNEHGGYCQVPTLYPFIEFVLKEILHLEFCIAIPFTPTVCEHGSVSDAAQI